MSAFLSRDLRATITRLCVASLLVACLAVAAGVIAAARFGSAAGGFAAFVVLLAAALLAHAAAGRITRPLSDLAEHARALARGEAFDVAPPVGGELRALADAIDSLGARLDRAEAHARRGGDSLARLVAPIEAGRARLELANVAMVEAATAAEQGASDTAASAARVRSSVDDLVENARRLEQSWEAVVPLAESASRAATGAEGSATDGIASTEELAAACRQAAARALETSELGRQACSIVDVLDDLADRMDRIALDAARRDVADESSCESRAAVATEMRVLAEDVATAARTARILVAGMQRASAACVAAAEGQVRAADRSAGEASRAGVDVRELGRIVAAIVDAMRSVAVAAAAQRTAAERIAEDAVSLGTGSRATADLAVRARAAGGDMARLAADLEAAARRLRVEDPPAAGAAG